MKASYNKYFSIFSEGKYILLLNAADKIFSFMILLMLARNFSTGSYGEIATIFTLCGVFITIFDFGLPIYLHREIAAGFADKNEIFNTVFITSILLFTGYILISTGFFLVFYGGSSILLFIVIAVMMYISSMVNICNRALSGVNELKSQFYSFSIPRILILAAFGAGIYVFSFSLNELMIVMLAGFLINLFSVSRVLKKTGFAFTLKNYSLMRTRSILSVSIPLGLAVIFNLLYDKIDVLLISKLKDFTEVAFYSAGYGLFKAGTLSFSFLLVPGFTKIASYGKDKSAVRDFFRNYAGIIIAICIVWGLFLFILAEPVIKFFYTEKFLPSAAILKILASGLIAVGLNNLTGVIINGLGYYKIVMYITLYALILNVILNLSFIPLYGITAAAVITVITEYFILFTEYYYMKKILNN